MISEHYFKAVEERVHDEAVFLNSPDGPAGLTILVLEDIPKLLATIRSLVATCGDCKAPISAPWHYRCWWCKVAFCKDCAAKHFGGPDDAKSAARAEQIKNAVDDDRIKTVNLIEMEQTCLTAADKRALLDQLYELWGR